MSLVSRRELFRVSPSPERSGGARGSSDASATPEPLTRELVGTDPPFRLAWPRSWSFIRALNPAVRQPEPLACVSNQSLSPFEDPDGHFLPRLVGLTDQSAVLVLFHESSDLETSADGGASSSMSASPETGRGDLHPGSPGTLDEELIRLADDPALPGISRWTAAAEGATGTVVAFVWAGGQAPFTTMDRVLASVCAR